MEKFYKYQALGNDFIVLDRLQSKREIDAETCRSLCDRHYGVGADGVLVILPEHGAAARMQVHNADGSIAQMCGNGLRCVVKYLAERIGKQPAFLNIATGAGVLHCDIHWNHLQVESVTVAMGPALLSAPFFPDGGPFVQKAIAGVIGTAISMGNPHLVLLDTPPSQASVLGPYLEHHELFPERTNVEFVTQKSTGGLAVTVWERGVGLTLACSTGACAAVAAAAIDGRVPFDAWIPVTLPGGFVEIKVAAAHLQVALRGPVGFVFEGLLP